MRGSPCGNPSLPERSVGSNIIQLLWPFAPYAGQSGGVGVPYMRRLSPLLTRGVLLPVNSSVQFQVPCGQRFGFSRSFALGQGVPVLRTYSGVHPSASWSSKSFFGLASGSQFTDCVLPAPPLATVTLRHAN